MRIWLLGFLLVVLLIPCQVFADISRFVRSIDSITIRSSSQKLLNNQQALFEGYVELLVDNKIHIWADRVFIDKQHHTIKAFGSDDSPLMFEHENSLVLADKLCFNLATKTGFADTIRIHVHDGYILASHACKKDEHTWEMRNITYTSCDHSHAHWRIRASHAQVYGGYFLTASGLSFKIGKLPIFWWPYLIIPLQGQSHSGFLMPRFFLDAQYGFGFKQEYYHSFTPHCDTTVAFDWRDRRGIVLSDEFRWARSLTDYTLIRAHYAIVRDMLAPDGEHLLKRTRYRYLIQGSDFSQSQLNDHTKAHRLLTIDVGTDKRVGYHFFNKVHDVENYFNTALIQRIVTPQKLISLEVNNQVTQQKMFTPEELRWQVELESLCLDTQNKEAIKHERESDVVVSHLPHFQINSAYYLLYDLIAFRYDFFVDFVTCSKRFVDRFFYQKALVAEQVLSLGDKSDSIRGQFHTTFRKSWLWHQNSLSCYVRPGVQLRSHILCSSQSVSQVYERSFFNQGAYRFLYTAGVEWGLPSYESSAGASDFLLQPSVRWEYSPAFDQGHWHSFDHYDRVYGKNSFTGQLHAMILSDDVSCSFLCEQGYDFSDAQHRFFLERSGSVHLLPFVCDIDFSVRDSGCAISCEYNLQTGKLLHAHCRSWVQSVGMNVSIGYLFQAPELLVERGLLSNLPHFFIIDCSLPVTDNLTVRYDGQFHAEGGHRFLSMSHLTPVFHRIGLEYRGHCWAAYLGFEEKKYKEYGYDKAERIIMLAVKFDALGSFAKKVKNYNVFKQE